jgi:Ca-activated chloride channel homolog
MFPNSWATKLVRYLLVTLLAFVLSSCGKEAETPITESKTSASAIAQTMRILAGSEIKDLEPLKGRMEKAAGTRIEFIYTGSLDAVERIESGENVDAVWVSHGKYLQLTPAIKAKIRASERIMTSPVILGIKTSKAAALGWDKADPTWAEIARTAASGKLSYGMTNPASSNTGFTALVGVAAALADKQDGLTAADIKTKELRQLFVGQKLTSGSSGWLAEAYVREQARFDGLINYESVILQLNADGNLTEKLTPIYPKEGIVTADYPLMLLNENKRKPYDELVKFLRSSEAQRDITQRTLRRPIASDVDAAAVIPKRTLAELPFPASRDVLDALLDAYQSQLRRPASTYFVLDVSGSMQGEGISQLRSSVIALTGADASLSGRFARFQTRERIYLLPFSGNPGTPIRFEMPDEGNKVDGVLANVRDYATKLHANGGTAIFSSVKVALEAAQADRLKAPDRQYSVVVMTDGKSESGMSENDFASWHQKLGETDRGIPVFGLLFGEAEKAQLERIAKLTGGRVFDARKGLKTAFKEIRGYQ